MCGTGPALRGHPPPKGPMGSLTDPPPPPPTAPHGLGVCIGMHLVNGTGNSPSPGRPTPGVVKQDKSSGGSVDTTKTRSGPQRVRMSSGERPIGAAKGTQSNTVASCQTPSHRRLAVGGCLVRAPERTWATARAVALPRVDPTRSSETGTVRGLRWHNVPRESKGK